MTGGLNPKLNFFSKNVARAWHVEQTGATELYHRRGSGAAGGGYGSLESPGIRWAFFCDFSAKIAISTPLGSHFSRF